LERLPEAFARVVPLVDLLAGDERVDLDGVFALDRDGVEFVVVHRDVSVLGVLVASPLIRPFDGFARDFVKRAVGGAGYR
jgi:hypothetical protein